MLLDFYGLREQPFGPTPDPRYFFPSASHREAATSLVQGIESGFGFLALVARPGMGKTSLLFQLLEDLKGTARTAFLFQTQCTESEFLQYLVEDLGISGAKGNVVSIHAKLNELLIEEAQAGRRVIVVIDEAQNLSESVLEMVRMLSNLETPQRKLIQFILAGQPQLAATLRRPTMVQLLQRISVLCHLKPLTPVEVAGFINHRLQVAGYAGDSLFTDESVLSIAKSSRGIPRLINDICFSALARGFEMNRRTIETKIVEEVLSDLSLETLMREVLPQPRQQVSKRPKAASLLLSLLRNFKILP
jgi:general secretion pathway protein A